MYTVLLLERASSLILIIYFVSFVV